MRMVNEWVGCVEKEGESERGGKRGEAGFCQNHEVKERGGSLLLLLVLLLKCR